jgi:hypothetical protein
MARNGGFGVYFEHLYTGVNGIENARAWAAIPARRDWAAKMIAGSVTFCDIV